jgi:protocatechuate 3,4-dioxygenase beta subunit
LFQGLMDKINRLSTRIHSTGDIPGAYRHAVSGFFTAAPGYHYSSNQATYGYDMIDTRRRRLMLGLGGSLIASPSLASMFSPTPRQTAGPFYPLELPLDDDNDLTRVSGKDGQARGTISDVSGRILDLNGKPLSNLRIEIWQCDANGRYRHPGDSGGKPVDENFQGHGFSLTDDNGAYRFRTIRPVPYPGRTPHIHVAVFAPGQRPFVTQLYVAGDSGNNSDFLYQRIPADKRGLVTAEFRASSHSGAELEAQFDVILDRRHGTPRDG